MSKSINIYYTGIGSNNKTIFNEKQFRRIIHNNIYRFHLLGLESYLQEAVENPLTCDIRLLLDLTGAYKSIL
jgi:hypothetical protein